MSRRSLVWLAVIAGVAFWLWKSGKVSKEGAPPPSPSASGAVSAGSAGWACVSAAEEASRLTQEAATVLLRTPVDPAAFSTASQGASASIASAESRCGGGGSPAEQRAMEEARGETVSRAFCALKPVRACEPRGAPWCERATGAK